MMPERLATTDAFTQVTEPIGSGPFVFVKDEWIPGSKVVYVRNPDYVPRPEPPSFAAGGKRVHVDRVEWLYIPDPATAQAALAAGEVDYYERPPVDLLPLMERDPGLIVAVIDPLGTQGWLRPNHLHPPFDRKEARQALLWMVNQEDYLRVNRRRSLSSGAPAARTSCAARHWRPTRPPRHSCNKTWTRPGN